MVLRPRSVAGEVLRSLYIVDDPFPVGARDRYLRAWDDSAYTVAHGEALLPVCNRQPEPAGR